MRLIRLFEEVVMRDYVISDEGDEFNVQLLENGQQVGGALFPDDGTGRAFDRALEMAQSWAPKEFS